MTTIINALLPVFVTLLLGYFAAWHHDDDSKAAATLNKMVMTYALPLSLFAGTVTISRGQIVSNLPLMGAMLVGIAVPFAAALAASAPKMAPSTGMPMNGTAGNEMARAWSVLSPRPRPKA